MRAIEIPNEFAFSNVNQIGALFFLETVRSVTSAPSCSVFYSFMSILIFRSWPVSTHLMELSFECKCCPNILGMKLAIIVLHAEDIIYLLYGHGRTNPFIFMSMTNATNTRLLKESLSFLLMLTRARVTLDGF
jgi:hypothetical protein